MGDVALQQQRLSPYNMIHSYLRRRWLVIALLVMPVAGVKAGGGVGPLDVLSGVTGTYTHLIDNDLAVTLSYDLQYDSFVPFSFLTGVSMTKSQDLYREIEPEVPIARLTLTGSTMTKQFIPSGGATVETKSRTVGINVNHASRRAQFRFGRSFMDGRLRVGLNPLLTYGILREQRVDFRTWVPSYRPLLSEAGMPRMSLQQRSVVWDWVQGMPQRSRLFGKGISLRVHTGRGNWLSATLFDGSERCRLWAVRAEMPLAKPSAALFSIERTWQVATTPNLRR